MTEQDRIRSPRNNRRGEVLQGHRTQLRIDQLDSVAVINQWATDAEQA